MLENPFSDKPTTRNVLEKSVCQDGRYKGRALTSKDGYLAPELSFDAKEVLFTCTEIADNEGERKRYSGCGYENNTYKIFRGPFMAISLLTWEHGRSSRSQCGPNQRDFFIICVNPIPFFKSLTLHSAPPAAAVLPRNLLAPVLAHGCSPAVAAIPPHSSRPPRSAAPPAINADGCT